MQKILKIGEKRLKNKKENLIATLFIILVSIFVSIPLFKFNIQYDDGIQHIARLIETEREIKNGNFIAYIMQNLCNGFGYSWNIFYSPLTSYLPLVFRIFGLSFENCLRLFMFCLSILSGYSMYFFMKKFLKNKDISDNKKTLISIISAAFYILAPYRLNDMYIRVAVSELASFVFIPIVFNGLYSIINLKEKNFILAFGAAGLLITHLLITFYTAILCAIYLIVNIKEIKGKEIIELLKNLAMMLLLTAFYWVPLLQSRIATNYEVFNQEHMVRDNVLINAKVKPKELFFIENDRMAYFLGIPVIIGLILTIKMIFDKKIEDKKNYYFFLISGLVCVLLTLNFIPFEKFPSMFTMMQFSFRLLEYSSFFLSIIASINLVLCFKKFNIFYAIIIVMIMADLNIPIVKNISFRDEYVSEADLIKGVAVTTNTGRVHAGCASFEYLPSKAFENRNYIATREDVPIVLNNNSIDDADNKNATDNEIEIKDYEKNRLSLSFKAKGTGVIELPYIYYIGYNAKIDGKKIETTESENGFVQICIDNNDYKEIEVSYTGTMAMKIALAISVITLILYILFIIRNMKIN